jgi:hypothetical protein
LEPSSPAGSARPILSEGQGLERLSSITISDSKGASQTLYFGEDPENKLMASDFLLPPLPPSGAFDARFENVDGGTMVETHGEQMKEPIEIPIRVQSSSYPLTVTWNITGETAYELKDALGGQRVPTRAVTGSGSLKITSNEVERLVLRVVGSDEIPSEYSLAQNYPNPFNPATVIKYALPVESSVLLKIFNTLGQEVRTLVSEVERAGYKSVRWNSQTERGTQAASGVYFIRLDAKGVNGSTFSHVRKMVLVK